MSDLTHPTSDKFLPGHQTSRTKTVSAALLSQIQLRAFALYWKKLNIFTQRLLQGKHDRKAGLSVVLQFLVLSCVLTCGLILKQKPPVMRKYSERLMQLQAEREQKKPAY